LGTHSFYNNIESATNVSTDSIPFVQVIPGEEHEEMLGLISIPPVIVLSGQTLDQDIEGLIPFDNSGVITIDLTNELPNEWKSNDFKYTPFIADFSYSVTEPDSVASSNVEEVNLDNYYLDW
jgi:hypothetical protein